MKSLAEIAYTSAENEDGRERECLFATCLESEDRVGPVWGQSEASVKRALAQLTEECSCGAQWHEEDDY